MQYVLTRGSWTALGFCRAGSRSVRQRRRASSCGREGPCSLSSPSDRTWHQNSSSVIVHTTVRSRWHMEHICIIFNWVMYLTCGSGLVSFFSLFELRVKHVFQSFSLLVNFEQNLASFVAGKLLALLFPKCLDLRCIVDCHRNICKIHRRHTFLQTVDTWCACRCAVFLVTRRGRRKDGGRVDGGGVTLGLDSCQARGCC